MAREICQQKEENDNLKEKCEAIARERDFRISESIEKQIEIDEIEKENKSLKHLVQKKENEIVEKECQIISGGKDGEPTNVFAEVPESAAKKAEMVVEETADSDHLDGEDSQQIEVGCPTTSAEINTLEIVKEMEGYLTPGYVLTMENSTGPVKASLAYISPHVMTECDDASLIYLHLILTYLLLVVQRPCRLVQS